MNILFLVNEYYPASTGAGNQVLGYAQALAERGHDVTVLTARDTAAAQLLKKKEEFSFEEIYNQTTIRRFDFSSFGPFWVYRMMLQLFRVIGRLDTKPDIIFGANLYLYGTLAAAYGWSHGIPSIVCTTGSDVDQVFDVHARLLTWLSLKLSTRVCIINSEQGEKLRLRLDRAYTFLPHTVDLPPHLLSREQAKEKLGLTSNDIYLLAIGRLQRSQHGDIKGFNYLLEAMKDLTGCQLLLIGSGPLAETYARFVQEHQLQQKVHLKGELPREQVWDYLAASDVFVLPSLHEGMSIALVEAMGVGLPVICTNVGGARDYVQEGVNGFLVEPGAPAALVKAIRTLQGDPISRQRMEKESKIIYTRIFSKERSGKGLESLFQSLLN